MLALGAVLYGLVAPWSATAAALLLFALTFGVIVSMYGGGFSMVPAYLADVFGTQFVGAIHGRLLTAWSTAGVFGPFIVTTMRDHAIAAGTPRAAIYPPIYWVLAGLLVVGFVANLFIKPVAARFHMTDAEVEATRPAGSTGTAHDGTIGIGSIDARVLIAWAAVCIPLAWGVLMTAEKAVKLFAG